MRLALTVTTALGINWITGCTNVPLGYSRSSSESGDVLHHRSSPLAGKPNCRLRFANSLCTFQLCSHRGLANPWKVQLGAAKIQWWNRGCLLIPARGASQTPLAASSSGLGAGKCHGHRHPFSRVVWWLPCFQKWFFLCPIISAEKLLCFVCTTQCEVLVSLDSL